MSLATLGYSVSGGLQAGTAGLATLGYGIAEEAEVVPDDDNTWTPGGRGRTWHPDVNSRTWHSGDRGRTWKA